MKKVLIVLGILLVAVLLVGCKKAEFAKPATQTGATGEATPIDNDIASLDSSADNLDSVDADLGSLDKDLDSL